MKNQLTFLLIFFCTFLVYSQKMKVTKGDLKNLKGITKYNLAFDYSNIEIPNYDSEEAFLEDKMKIRENKKIGDGERFRKSWFADRENRYEPKFVESFNTYFKEGEIKVEKSSNGAQYTMTIHTNLIYSGYNVGVWRHDAKLEATIIIYNTFSPSEVLFSANFIKIKGGGDETAGFDFNSGDRIAFSYSRLGKYFAKKIRIASKRKSE